VAQNEPAVHGTQLDALRPPTLGLRVPTGQGCGESVPAGQKWPAGHGPLAGKVSLGVGVAAPVRHKKPALHWPVGAVNVLPSQYEPAGQDVHSLALPTNVCVP
jgi:hypothetical protein